MFTVEVKKKLWIWLGFKILLSLLYNNTLSLDDFLYFLRLFAIALKLKKLLRFI